MPKPRKPANRPLINSEGQVRKLRANDTVVLSPLRDHFPALAAASRAKKRGRPPIAAPKKLQSFKLSPDVISAIRTSGAGYNVRVEAVLRRALEQGLI